MSNLFAKATKEKAKLRLAIFGPSGAGKTFTSLSIAKGLGGKVALIDTERHSASKYADRFTFDVADLDKPTVDNYRAFIEQAKDYDVLIIDSLTHGWKDLLAEVDKIANAKFRGNTWSAWSEGTPKQNAMVDAILSFPGHVIATMRSKTEWSIEQTDRGKTKPVRVGLAPEQGKGIEYEFDMLLEMSVDNIGHVIKDRTGKFHDEIIDKPGEELGKELKTWLNTGKKPVEREPLDIPPAPPIEQPAPPVAAQAQPKSLPPKKAVAESSAKLPAKIGTSASYMKAINDAMQKSNLALVDVMPAIKKAGFATLQEVTVDRYGGLLKWIQDNPKQEVAQKAQPTPVAPAPADEPLPEPQGDDVEQLAADALGAIQ